MRVASRGAHDAQKRGGGEVNLKNMIPADKWLSARICDECGLGGEYVELLRPFCASRKKMRSLHAHVEEGASCIVREMQMVETAFNDATEEEERETILGLATLTHAEALDLLVDLCQAKSRARMRFRSRRPTLRRLRVGLRSRACP